jgi:UDP-N-acetylglucosamine 2-epimerase (non-hydrolysing)
MKLITVVGARPNFMKAAPIIAAIRKHNSEASARPRIDHLLVHTGQHYDALMSDAFFADLDLPVPDVRLGVGSASQAVQTAGILKAFEAVLLRERPDVVLVVGDVNSTIACALCTAKIAFDTVGTRPLLAHVEAGLRSFDRAMPEEVNRVVTDHVADLLFVTEESGIRNLEAEGIARGAVHFVGNTMIDSLLTFKERAEKTTILEKLGLRAGSSDSMAPYALLTLHRPSNVDNPDGFRRILGGLEELARTCPIIFPVHPRTRQRIQEFGLEFHSKDNGIVLTDPLGYLEFLCLMRHASIVVTDSGGIQEETTCLGVPCVTARENTERPATVENGTNVIAGTTKEGLASAIQRQMGRKGPNAVPEKWDGQAAPRILEVLIRACEARIPLHEPAAVAQRCA